MLSGILEDLKFPAISYFRYFLSDSLHKINKVGYKRDHALKIYKLGSKVKLEVEMMEDSVCHELSENVLSKTSYSGDIVEMSSTQGKVLVRF